MVRDMTTITQARIKTLEKANEKLRTENTRIDNALLAASNELTDATAQIQQLNEENRLLLEQLQEAEYAYTLLTKQADENYKRAQTAEANLSRYQTVTVARRCKNEMACDGDGNGPGWCDHDAKWEIQRMEDDGSHYSYVCNDHLDHYQKWADSEGYAPLVFETE